MIIPPPHGLPGRSDLLVVIDDIPHRLDSRRVRRIVELDRITPVPGLPPPAEGLALAEDRLTMVVRIGNARGGAFAVLYDVNETQIALVGAELAGFSDDESLPTYDVESMFARIESSVWASRAARRAPSVSGVISGSKGTP